MTGWPLMAVMMRPRASLLRAATLRAPASLPTHTTVLSQVKRGRAHARDARILNKLRALGGKHTRTPHTLACEHDARPGVAMRSDPSLTR